MKYGVLDFNMTVSSYWKSSWNKKALLNIGDAVEYLSVEQLLNSIGVNEDSIVRLSIKDLVNYDGDFLIVPINIAFDSYVDYNNVLENLSPKLIPVFLGISLTNTNLNEKQLSCLRKYAPIGCRDERTFWYLNSQNIDAYLNGCIATILDTSFVQAKNEVENKVLFIDVPRKVASFIPDDLKKDIVFLSQEVYCRENEFLYKTPNVWRNEVLSHYVKPKLIVTSRFHGAVIALANNIPCILTLERETFRFSWLKNYMPLYTEDNFSEIDWKITNYKIQHIEKLKAYMKLIAQKRIKEVVDKYESVIALTEMQLCESKIIDSSSNGNQVLYYKDVIELIKHKWKKEEKIEFGFWGINDNSDKIFDYLAINYPMAKLVDVYDMFKEITYKNIRSKSPYRLRERNNQQNYYVIVTAYLASRVSNDIFERVDFDSSRALLCNREFVDENYL